LKAKLQESKKSTSAQEQKDTGIMVKEEAKGDVSKLTFEQSIKELTGIVGKIEQGEIALADSIQQYEKGMALIKHCRKILQEAEKRIERIAKEEGQDK
jgi:exodeoxyribonuclease VII small subunit